MNIRALRLPILFTGFILSVLVSLSAFSMRSYAYYELPTDPGKSIDIGYDSWYGNVSTYGISNNVRFGVFTSGGRYYGCWFSTSSNSQAFYVTTRYGNELKTCTDRRVANNTVFYSVDYSLPNANLYPGVIYSSRDALLSSGREFVAPEFADFGFNNISYTTYLPPNNSLLFEQYHFDALSYFFTWHGSTHPEFPITSFNYELYGFFDTGMSNTDKSNGELVDSGSHSVPNVFSYEPPYGSLLDIWGALKYDKVILYLTPFSNITEGNTFYVVLNVVRGVGFEVNLGPLGSIDIGSSVRDVQFGDGVLPVPQTDALLIEDDKYMPVGYIDQVPVIYVTKTTSGSYNRHIDIYHENISYAPVVYGDSEYITNNDNSKVTNNNQSYNVIINNINGSVNLDPDGSGYADSIVSFLSMIVVFFQTCWTYFFQGLLFFPDWVRNLISGLIGLLATIVAALAVLKIMRGIL